MVLRRLDCVLESEKDRVVELWDEWKGKVEDPPSVILNQSGGVRLERWRPECARRGVADIAQFVGFRTDVDDFYALMDVSVLSSMSEDLSMPPVESMLNAVPVFVTNVCGTLKLWLTV